MKIGFLGFGNMAQALTDGLLRSGKVAPDEVAACARNWEKLCRNAGLRGIRPLERAAQVADFADVVVVAVKPRQVEEVLTPLRGRLAGKIVLSVAAGFTFDRYDAGLLLDAINRAKTVYFTNRYHWDEIVQRDMAKDVSWQNSAKQYKNLYLELTQW